MYYLKVLDIYYYFTSKYFNDRDEAFEEFQMFKASGDYIRGYLISAETLLILDKFDKEDEKELPF